MTATTHDYERLQVAVAQVAGDAYARELTDWRSQHGYVGARHGSDVWVMYDGHLYARFGPPGTPIVHLAPEHISAFAQLRARYQWSTL